MLKLKPPGQLLFLIRRPSAQPPKRIAWEVAIVATMLVFVGFLVWLDPTELLSVADATSLGHSVTLAPSSGPSNRTDQMTTSELMAALNDARPDARLSAAQALGWRRTTQAEDALLGATNDSDARVVEEAAAALGEIGDVKALPRLQALQVVQGNANIQLAAFEAEDALTERIAAQMGVPRSQVQAIAVAANGQAYAAMGDALYLLDQGRWDRVSHLPASPTGLALSPDGMLIYLATPVVGIYRSRDGGRSWEHSDFGPAEPLSVTAAVIDPQAPQAIYMALATGNGTPGHASATAIVASHDGGVTWVSVPKAPTQQVTTRLVLDPAAPMYLYGLTSEGPYRLSLTGNVGDFQLD